MYPFGYKHAGSGGATTPKHVVVVGSGNAAFLAGIAALEAGTHVTMLEKGEATLGGGNTNYTAGAMRFAYAGGDDLPALLSDLDDPRVASADFGA